MNLKQSPDIKVEIDFQIFQHISTNPEIDENIIQGEYKIVNHQVKFHGFKNSGIYQIKNLKTGDFYIGKSKDILKRVNEHLRLLRLNAHRIKYLQNDFNLYGEENFEFYVILNCPPAHCCFYEQILIKELNPKYNSLSCSKEI